MRLLELESLLEGGLKELGTTLGPRVYFNDVAAAEDFDLLVETGKEYEDLDPEERLLASIFSKTNTFPSFFRREAAYNRLRLRYETDAEYPAGMEPDAVISRVYKETVKVWPDGAEEVAGVWLSHSDGSIVVDYDVEDEAYPLWASWLWLRQPVREKGQCTARTSCTVW